MQHRTQPYRKGTHRHQSLVYDPNNRASRFGGASAAMDPASWIDFDLDLRHVQGVSRTKSGIPGDAPLHDGCARVLLKGGHQVTLMDPYSEFIKDVWEPWLAENT